MKTVHVSAQEYEIDLGCMVLTSVIEVVDMECLHLGNSCRSRREQEGHGGVKWTYEVAPWLSMTIF